MTFPALLLVLFASVAPESRTDWMQPSRLGISIGMPRQEVESILKQSKKEILPGKVPEHLVVELSEKKSVTLAFEEDRLQSARFELVEFPREIAAAFSEVERRLANAHGKPTDRKQRPSVLVYDGTDPRIYVVASTDPRTGFGKQGVGFLVVRYFAPPPATI
ncbi:MAG TPA: hypothetical protein VM557_12175 [Thermoanaerobaculia bacterium]|nr:hypothetical protein [Thermoanaerobaculia bacterium]